MKLGNDSFALFLLCSHLGLRDEPIARPLSAREWNRLEQVLAASSVSAADLRNLGADRIKSILQGDGDEAARIASLLDRGSALEQELERLAELGIWVVTRFDEGYPPRFTERLQGAAPVILYGAGDPRLLSRRGVAVVGSRSIDQRGFALTELIGNACAESRLSVYSGGARGVDKTAMGAALEAGGCAAGLLADSLERAIRAADARGAIEEGQLVLATAYSPHSSFNVGMAMARNKLIYALSDFALVIASDAEKGGTWAGAEEALKSSWVPVFVVDGPDVPDGNKLLIKRGAIPFPFSFDDRPSSLGDWLEAHSPADEPVAVQGSLFS
ncbi:MAG TPA: DNA-processing protein DprA [Blastocatellia bacterium]|nr:DNA-processing protein DprA [Blastocatellia bacterium]